MKNKKGKNIIFGYTHSRVWFIVTVVLLVIVLVFNVVVFNYITTVFDNLFGGDVSSGREEGEYTTDDGITDKESAKANGDAVTQEICEEGFVLLKNDDNTLPLETSVTNKKKVSVFGKNSVNLAYGGSGSGSTSSDDFKTIYDSLESAGYEYNTTLKSFYESSVSGSGRPSDLSTSAGTVTGFATGETPVSSYTDTVKNSFSSYDDLAIVVISRTCGESYDVPTTMMDSSGKAVTGAYSADDHYLELDLNEQEMLKMVCQNFSKVVLVINSSQTFELGFLDDVDDGDDTVIDYDFASHIQSCIWIGGPGGEGIMALGEILNGSINPSGHTVDTYARDFTASPAYVNVGSTSEGNGVTSDEYYQGSKAMDGYYYSDYEEGIYVGYKYYETRAYTDGEDWYTNNVVYPFGYGLSYTTFTWTVTDSPDGEELKKDSTVSVTVHVENDTDIAGKDVVQLYVRTPYTDGGIEKADKVLCAYAKTTEITKTGGGCDVTLEFDAYDIASYDSYDKNGNKFYGYELDEGEYTFFISTDAHTSVAEFTMTVASGGIQFSEDTTTGNTVENLYDDLDDQLGQQLSRSDWEGTWPQKRTISERTYDSSFFAEVDSTETNNPLTEDSDEVQNSDLTYATKKDSENSVKIYEMAGVEYDDERWDEFMSHVTISTMIDTLGVAAFGVKRVDYLGIPKTIEPDGPVGFTQFMGGTEVYGTCSYASEPVLGSTWNVELAEKMGTAIGNESLIGDGNDPYSGWYAPGVNIHRTPFGGRNYEYYSEDSTLSGYMAAYVIKGASSKGVTTYMKHFVANDQETHRNGVCTWMTEQTLREVYLKPFEIAVKKSGGNTHGVMSSFNRLGTTWTGGDYRLLTSVLRDEWGFEGAVICDFKTGSYMDYEQMQYAGGDLYLNNVEAYVTNWVDKNNDLDVYVIKNCFKNYMYVLANSNAMNGLTSGYSTRLANWKIVVIVCDCAVVVALATWGVFAIRGSIKKKRNDENIE